MSKHKDSKVLFEALANKGVSETMKVPEWMKAKKAEEADIVAEATPDGSPQTSDLVSDPEAEVDSSSAAPSVVRTRRSDGYFSRVDEIPTPTVSVSFTQLAVALVMVLLLLGGAFWMGVRVGSPDTSAPADPSGPSVGTPTVPINTGSPKIVDLGTPIPADPNAPVLAVEGKRDANRYYLIVQVLNSADATSKAEADRIQAFLATKGIAVSIDKINNRTIGKTYYSAWDRLGYPSSRSEAAMQRIAQIETLGKEYFRLHKTHRFSGPFFINGYNRTER